MKILAAVLLSIFTSGTFYELFSIKGNKDFNQLMVESFYDTDLSVRKIPNKNKDIKLIRVDNIPDVLLTITTMSVEMPDQVIVHYIKFSSTDKFKVDEKLIKKLAKEKDCDMVVYVEATDVKDYQLYSDRQTYKIKTSEGYHFFNAFFYSKVSKNIAEE